MNSLTLSLTFHQVYHLKHYLCIEKSAQTPTASEPSGNNTSILVIKTREGAITKVTGDGLTGPNWVSWQVRIKSLLALCEVEPYVRGEINQPNMEDDPTGA